MINFSNIAGTGKKYLRKGIVVNAWLFLFLSVLLFSCGAGPDKNVQTVAAEETPWRGWNKYQIKPEDTMVVYGRELIENTAYYFGPKGTIAAITNGMNCQNCHLDGGTLPWANNYSAVVSTYPKFRDRSGSWKPYQKELTIVLKEA
jgi:thiosulfate dehydrogenase